MESSMRDRFSREVTVFREQRLPTPAALAGYAALVEAFSLKVPLPRRLSAIGHKHRLQEADGWRIFTPRHRPEPSLGGHLTFALKHEGIELAVLKRAFEAIGPGPIEDLVRATPTGKHARRIWFLYEWLLGTRLDLPDAAQGAYVPVIDEHRQWAAPSTTSTRHRVRANLPGTPSFCPLAYRTPTLERLTNLDLAKRARDVIAKVPADVVARAAAFLLLEDSKTSYAIEGERAPQNRIQRWGRAIGDAGKHALDVEELLRLQRIVIGDARFVKLGLREEGGFVGTHDRDTNMPLPVHVSARPEDLSSLVGGMVSFASAAMGEIDPVIASAALAFGFVYVHPFADGNGRIHRYLIHHALAQRGFNPPGVVFPVSAAILRSVARYRRVLEDYSQRLLPLIDWEPTEKGNVWVRNDTADFYRFFDVTPHAEFLYDCVRETIEEDLPTETGFLQRYDEFCARLQDIADMPNHTAELLFHFLRQNQGRLPNRARGREFAQLTDEEVTRIEQRYDALFGQAGEQQ
jgi:hypothetical protein